MIEVIALLLVLFVGFYLGFDSWVDEILIKSISQKPICISGINLYVLEEEEYLRLKGLDND